MRETKFRAWDKLLGKMLPWDEIVAMNFAIKYLTQSDTLELMQYTGLKDKNGKEIYNGDILCYGMWSDGKGKCLYKVFWNEEDARFDALDLRHNQEMTHVDTYEAEVIGNIYENPELKGESNE